jgi:HTH-type transcriptional regulator/antitoxin HipB
MIIFPYGNIYGAPMRYTPKDLGKIVSDTRKKLGVTQKDLALTSGTGLRFVIDLEKGKETCQIGKALTILQTLGIKLALTPPATPAKGE